MSARFFERFREELGKYATGVHRTGAPASTAALQGLPAELASFLRSFDGAELFVDAYVIHPASQMTRDGRWLVFGETSSGDRLALDVEAGAEPPVVRLEEDTGEAHVEGTSFARWLDALMAAESVVFDREGEFREEVFDEEGELLPAAVVKRETKALKRDPDAPAPAWRLARALVSQDRTADALRTLDALTAKTPSFGWAWYDLGRLHRQAGELTEAEEAYRRAAEADPAYEHAGWFAAHAARMASLRDDENARAAHAQRALELDPGLTQRQKQAAVSQLQEQEGEHEEIRELLELALALAPRDLELLSLRRKLGAKAG